LLLPFDKGSLGGFILHVIATKHGICSLSNFMEFFRHYLSIQHLRHSPDKLFICLAHFAGSCNTSCDFDQLS